MKSYILLLLSVVVTDLPGYYTRDGVVYESAEACVAAAQDGLGAQPRTCEQVNRVVIQGSCEDVPRPAFEPELVGHQCPGSDSRWYFTETRQASSAYPRCWKVVEDPVSDCAARETYWTPQPGDYVPPLDPYVQVAPEPQ